MKCDKCQNKAYCDEHVGIRRICKRNGYDGFVMFTNADKIRSMNDGEVADFLVSTMTCTACRDMHGGQCPKPFVHVKCRDMILDWLKSPVEIDNGN